MNTWICANCGWTNQPEKAACVICFQQRTDRVLPPKPPEPVEADGRRSLRGTFGLSSLLLLIAVLGVSMGVMREALGIGILLAIIATPACVRACLAAARHRARGQPMRIEEGVQAFASSLCVVTVIVSASGVAFFAACFPIGLATFVPDQDTPGMVVAFVLGFVAAGVAAYFVGRRLWPWKDQP